MAARNFRASVHGLVSAVHPHMPLRLVLIEDHQALREGLELLLGREGIEVLGTAGTAAEGQELVEQLATRTSR